MAKEIALKIKLQSAMNSFLNEEELRELLKSSPNSYQHYKDEIAKQNELISQLTSSQNP